MDFKVEDYVNDSSSIRERIVKKEAITSKIIKKTQKVTKQKIGTLQEAGFN